MFNYGNTVKMKTSDWEELKSSFINMKEMIEELESSLSRSKKRESNLKQKVEELENLQKHDKFFEKLEDSFEEIKSLKKYTEELEGKLFVSEKLLFTEKCVNDTLIEHLLSKQEANVSAVISRIPTARLNLTV